MDGLSSAAGSSESGRIRRRRPTRGSPEPQPASTTVTARAGRQAAGSSCSDIFRSIVAVRTAGLSCSRRTRPASTSGCGHSCKGRAGSVSSVGTPPHERSWLMRTRQDLALDQRAEPGRRPMRLLSAVLLVLAVGASSSQVSGAARRRRNVGAAAGRGRAGWRTSRSTVPPPSRRAIRCPRQRAGRRWRAGGGGELLVDSPSTRTPSRPGRSHRRPR